MRKAYYLLISAAFSTIGIHESVRAETPEEIRDRVLLRTKVNYVRPGDLSVPVSQYKGDGDPTTLEIFMLPKDVDLPSRVSEDGEVIIFHDKDSKELTQQLFQRAFEIRLARALRGT